MTKPIIQRNIHVVLVDVEGAETVLWALGETNLRLRLSVKTAIISARYLQETTAPHGTVAIAMVPADYGAWEVAANLHNVPFTGMEMEL